MLKACQYCGSILYRIDNELHIDICANCGKTFRPGRQTLWTKIRTMTQEEFIAFMDDIINHELTFWYSTGDEEKIEWLNKEIENGSDIP